MTRYESKNLGDKLNPDLSSTKKDNAQLNSRAKINLLNGSGSYRREQSLT